MTNSDSTTTQVCPTSTPSFFNGGFANAGGYHVQARTRSILTFSFHLPAGAVVKAARIGLHKNQGRAMPGMLPTVTLYETDYTAAGRGKRTLVGGKPDTSPSVAAYNAFHLVGPALDHQVRPGCLYTLEVIGDDTHANSGEQLCVYHPVLDLVMPSAPVA